MEELSFSEIDPVPISPKAKPQVFKNFINEPSNYYELKRPPETKQEIKRITDQIKLKTNKHKQIYDKYLQEVQLNDKGVRSNSQNELPPRVLKKQRTRSIQEVPKRVQSVDEMFVLVTEATNKREPISITPT